jgi:hypothetical protein
MSNFKNYLKDSAKFAKKYAKQYFKLLIKPIIVGLIGLASVGLVYIHPLLSIAALLISIPCTCYSFWNGYVTTYSLNNAAMAFSNNEEKELKDCLIDKNQKKQLALWLGFCALICLVAFAPAMIFMGKTINLLGLTNPTSLLSNIQGLCLVSLVFFIITAILLPFLNFFNQALFFKKEEENNIKLFLNCYKKLDKTGVWLSITFTIIGGMLSVLGYIYPLLALIFNLFTFSANTFWYSSKMQETIQEENTL